MFIYIFTTPLASDWNPSWDQKLWSKVNSLLFEELSKSNNVVEFPFIETHNLDSRVISLLLKGLTLTAT